MRRWTTLQCLLLLLCIHAYAHRQAPFRRRDYDSHDYYALHLRASTDIAALADHLGLLYEGPLGELPDHHIFRTAQRQHEYDHVKTHIRELRRRRRARDVSAEDGHILDSILFSQKQELHKRFPLVKRDASPRPRPDAQFSDGEYQPDEAAVAEGLEIAKNLSIADPIFQEQWHLHNNVQVGHDINVTGVWQQNITGKGSIVCIVDDGLDMDSLDLRDNYFAEGSYDFNDQVKDPKPRLSDDHHGTRCAGEISAVRNDVCGVGVAYDGKVSGCRILSKVISDADEAVAMNYEYQQNHIYSCSWGPPDDGTAMEGPGILIRRAMVNGIQNGRSGLGSIYVFAIGNGAASDDNCNFDGYTNSIYSVSVGAIDREGKHPYYSEQCSAQLVVTYSSGGGDAIHTTDVGLNECYNSHGGTSAAGPLVAGIYALMLEANPKLNWRDIQWLTVMTAVKVQEESDYQRNEAMNKDYSHQFGYGKADAYALVEAAKTWKSVKPQAWFFSPWLHVNHALPQGEQGVASHFDVTEDMLKDANLERLEHVTVTMNVAHTRRGDLSAELRSPSGMVSYIATHRRNDAHNSGYVDWTFMSVAHWGESGVGRWTVIVKDTIVNEHSGTFTDWHIKLWGEAIDGDKQELLPMPTEHDDDDHAQNQTQSALAHTTTVAVPTDHTGMPPGNPTDHPDRPTKPKPQTSAVPAESSSTPLSEPTSSPTPSPTPVIPDEGTKEEEVDEPASTPLPSPSSSNFLPHPFPTFGVSKRTQIWIYGTIVLILIFLLVLSAWLIWMRRKKRWMNRADYGFEMVDHDDHDDSAPLANGNGYASGGLGRRKKRAGELYDAFAEGTDDEAEMFELGSDDEESSDDGERRGMMGGRREKEERYRDVEPTKEGTDVT